MRSGGSFRVVLYAEDRPAAVAHAFERIVVQVDVGRLEVARQRLQANGEAVVLRGNFNALRALIEHRLVGAAVAEF